MGGIEVMTSSTFNVSTKTEVDIQPHASAAVLLKEITSILHWIGGLLGLRLGLTALNKKGNFLPLPGIEPPFIQAVV